MSFDEYESDGFLKNVHPKEELADGLGELYLGVIHGDFEEQVK